MNKAVLSLNEAGIGEFTLLTFNIKQNFPILPSFGICKGDRRSFIGGIVEGDKYSTIF